MKKLLCLLSLTALLTACGGGTSTEPLPQKPFPSVRKSASTNERIIENRRGLGSEATA